MRSVTKRDSPLQGQSLFILTILVVGFSGLVAQVLLLRELLVSFYGNELTLGVILANWVITEALGVFVIGKLIDRIKYKINVFVWLEILFSLMLPFSIFLFRIFKGLLGIPFGEGIGLAIIFYSSFFIVLPIGFCHGALFSSGCKIYSLYTKESAPAIGKIYAFEIIGTIIGGIIFTYLFIPYLNSFQIVFVIAISNLVICLFFFKDISKLLRYMIFSLIAFVLLFLFVGGSDYLQYSTINKQWKNQRVLDYRNSVYGNIVTAKKEGQTTFFYNGIPVITTPYPDKQFVQEFGNLPLLFHSGPQDVLIISGGAGGLINEILKHPIRKIDYAELDPLLIKLIKKYPSELTQNELTDNHVNIINLDGRLFLKNTLNQYDVILLGLAKPQDLSSNRLFTQEFFLSAKKKLRENGILSLYLPGSLTYLGQELKDLNACILNGLKNTYAYARIIPGDYNIFIASDSPDVLKVNAGLITQRINERKIKDTILIPGYLDYRLGRAWQEWFNKTLEGATKGINQDFHPIALFEILSIWNKQFSPRFMNIFNALKNLNIGGILILITLLTFILFYIIQCKAAPVKLSVIYSIATTGFFSMLANLILIFSFQVFFGYLYYKIGILISVFMAGIALGSIIITRRLERINNPLSLFIKTELLMVIFSFFLPQLITGLGRQNSSLIFMLLFFISGILTGLEFPLASQIYMMKKWQVGETAGLLYFFDLLGGWVAGIFGGIVFLPILGLFNTCMVMVLLKLSSLLLLVIFSKRLTKIII